MQTFHYALKPSGTLVVGKSESIGAAIDLFETLDKNKKLFKKKATHRIVNLNFAPRITPGFPSTSSYQERVTVGNRRRTSTRTQNVKMVPAEPDVVTISHRAAFSADRAAVRMFASP